MAPDENQRAAPRVDVSGLDRLAQRTNLIAAGADGTARKHHCRITDASATGYRVVLISASPNEGRHFTPGMALVLEHIDGWRREVAVRWVRGNMVGLQIMRAVTRLIFPDGALADCVILADSGSLFRITLDQPCLLDGEFELELANGLRRRVRERWRHGPEICLQLVEARQRL